MFTSLAFVQNNYNYLKGPLRFINRYECGRNLNYNMHWPCGWEEFH